VVTGSQPRRAVRAAVQRAFARPPSDAATACERRISRQRAGEVCRGDRGQLATLGDRRCVLGLQHEQARAQDLRVWPGWARGEQLIGQRDASPQRRLRVVAASRWAIAHARHS